MKKDGWFIADEDDKVVAKTEVKDDGTVHVYEYTKPDDISKGHGHKVYKNLNDYYDDDKKPEWSRDKNDSDSKNRGWRGNGYDLGLLTLEILISKREELLNKIQKQNTKKLNYLKKEK